MAADERIRQRAEAAGLFKTAKNSVDEPQGEYRLAGFGGQPGWSDSLLPRPSSRAEREAGRAGPGSLRPEAGHVRCQYRCPPVVRWIDNSNRDVIIWQQVRYIATISNAYC